MANSKEAFFQNEWDKNRLFKLELDRLKHKKFIYTSFPAINQNGFIGGDFRRFLLADLYARFYRMNSFNVLYAMGYNNLATSAMLEEKKQRDNNNKELYLKFRDELKLLGVGFDSEKEIIMNDDAYIRYIQEAFLALYHKSIIKYQKETIYVNKSSKLFHSFEIEKRKDKYYVKDSKDELTQKEENVFVLDISKMGDSIAKEIEKIDLLSIYKHQLLNFLEPKEYLDIPLNTTANSRLTITMDNPEFLAGISFICLNPNLFGIAPFISEEELPSVENFLLLNSESKKAIFSGTLAINPLTSYEIPIFISNCFSDTSIYLGIPSLRNEDFDFCLQYGLDHLDVLEDDILINSDFMSELNTIQARRKIIDTFTYEDMGTLRITYKRKNIIISSLDKFGCIIPILKDVSTDDLYPLDDNLPIKFSNRYRPVIPNEENMKLSGSLLPITLSKLFCNGLACIGSKLYDENNGITNPFSKGAIPDFNRFGEADLYICKENELFQEVFIPIVMQLIVSEYHNIPYFPVAKKILIEEPTYDQFGLVMAKNNNNLVNISEDIQTYSADAIRLFYYSVSLTESLNYDIKEILGYHQFVHLFKKCFYNEFLADNYALDLPIHQLVNDVNKAITNQEVSKIVGRITSFFKNKIANQGMTKDQAFVLLKLCSIFIPHTCEEIYKDVFKGKYFLITEDYPC